jgi:hypothetical protein
LGQQSKRFRMLGNDKRQTCRLNLCGVCPVNQQRPL